VRAEGTTVEGQTAHLQAGLCRWRAPRPQIRSAQQDSIRSPCSKHDTSAILTACGGTDHADVSERCALPAQSTVGSADGNPPMGWRTEQVLSGVARGCSTPDFQEGDKLLVGVNVDAAGKSSMVVSTAELYAAH